MSNITTEQTYNSIYLEGILQGNKFQATERTTFGASASKKFGIKTGNKKCLLGVQLSSAHLMRIVFHRDAAYNNGSTTFPAINCNDDSNITSDLIVQTGLTGGVSNGNIIYGTYSTNSDNGNIGINKGCNIEGIILNPSDTYMFLVNNISAIASSASFIVSWYEFD